VLCPAQTRRGDDEHRHVGHPRFLPPPYVVLARRRDAWLKTCRSESMRRAARDVEGGRRGAQNKVRARTSDLAREGTLAEPRKRAFTLVGQF